MTAADFTALQARLGISRAEFCRRLGIAENTGTAYALGRQPIPRTAAMACTIDTQNGAWYGSGGINGG